MPTAVQLRKSAMAYEDAPYLGSLVIDTNAWAKVAAAIGPDVFMTVVSDQFVFFGQMPDGAGLESFKKTVADDCAARQRCISPHLYRFRDGQWVAQ